MATLVAATIVSINPANELLACPDGAPVLLSSFANREVRLLQHGRSIVVEDDLDIRWEELAGVVVDEVIFFSRHTAVSNRPALTVHRIGFHALNVSFPSPTIEVLQMVSDSDIRRCVRRLSFDGVDTRWCPNKDIRSRREWIRGIPHRLEKGTSVIENAGPQRGGLWDPTSTVEVKKHSLQGCGTP